MLDGISTPVKCSTQPEGDSVLEPKMRQTLRDAGGVGPTTSAAVGVRERLVSIYTKDAVGVVERVIAEDDRKKLPTRKKLKAGQVDDPIEIGSDDLIRLLVRILAPRGSPSRVLWHRADSEALVLLKRTRAAVLDGFVLVGITLQTDQTGAEELTVPISVSNTERLTGMLAATESVPRGHSALAEVWGEGVIALAWEALLKLADLVTSLVGTDVDGNPLRIGALIAEHDSLFFVPQARHRDELLRKPPVFPNQSPKNGES